MVDVTDIEALEAFVVGNTELEQLEGLLDQFNLFEAIGAVRQELRHSDFLAFLLDPRGNHGLGDLFAKRLLQKVLVNVDRSAVPISPIDLELWSLDNANVFRERDYLDILLEDREHRLVVVIENKVDSGEHSDQLPRARKVIDKNYPGWKALYLFLTPDGHAPSDSAFIPVSYGDIRFLIEQMTETRASTLGADVRTLMVHYVQMLRRHIVSDSDIAELSRRIYQKHKKALDLIYEHRPDQQAIVREILEGLVTESPGLTLDHCTKTFIRFCPMEWDTSVLRQGTGWTASGRTLLFEFKNEPTKLALYVVIGPGPTEVRQAILDTAKTHTGLLRPARTILTSKWLAVYQQRFLESNALEDVQDADDLRNLIDIRWKKFLHNDLPAIIAALAPTKWEPKVGLELLPETSQFGAGEVITDVRSQ